MRKKIVLFYPDVLPPGALYYDTTNLLSVLCASRMLDREKYEIVIVTRRIYGGEYLDIILQSCNNAVCFGVSAMIGYQIIDGLNASKEVKRKFPNLPIIWGGWFASAQPELTLENPYIDILVIGQGELALKETVNAIDNNRPLNGIRGILFKDSTGKIIKNDLRLPEDINSFNVIPYDLVDPKSLTYLTDAGKTIDYITSFGCPHRCSFCVDPLVNKRKWIGLDPERVINEISVLKEQYGIHAVCLIDTNFFVDKKRVRKICELYIKKNLDVSWLNLCGRISHLVKFEDDLWPLLERINIKRILIGLESGSQEFLDLIQKDNKIEDVVTVIKKCDSYNIKLYLSFMIGLPSVDIDKEFDGVMNLISKILEITDKNVFALFIYMPFAGTQLYPLAIEHGFVPPEDLEGWGCFDQNKKLTPWVPGKYVKLTKMLQFFFKYILVDDLVYSTPSKTLRGFYKILYKVFNPIVKWRIKNHYWRLPIDYYFLFVVIEFFGKKIQRILDKIPTKI